MSTSDVETSNPFDGFDFSNCEPNADQKSYLTSLIIDGKFGAAEVAKRTHLSRKRLNQFVRVVRHGGNLTGKGGRPRILDTNSLKLLSEQINSQDPPCDDDIKRLIKVEFGTTLKRRPGSTIMNKEGKQKYVKISSRSLDRYALGLKSGKILVAEEPTFLLTSISLANASNGGIRSNAMTSV